MKNTPGNEQIYSHIDALIFDLDGVITQTRDTHKKAWTEMFNHFFKKENKQQSALTEDDYLQFIDGKPRYQGVQAFLQSRNIHLPFGTPSDKPGFDTICALGNIKNELFNKILETDGVDVYTDAIDKIKYWRNKGMKTAIVSSSKNCQKIIQVAGIEDLFDTRVDGLISELNGLTGKPDPDIFIDAARRLGARPEKSIVFEDAISGVKAGQSGYFGLVVGVNRFDQKEELIQNGADITIENFTRIDLSDPTLIEEFFAKQGIPVFPDNNSELFSMLAQRKPVIFLDYDGTLSPIVPRPEDAVISDSMKQTLKELAKFFTVAIVTGRDKDDVENLVGLKDLLYAGSHGFIITGPDGLFMEHPESEKIIPRLDEIEKELAVLLNEKTQGTQLDRKRYAIGIHYRNARPEDEKTVKKLVDEMIAKYPGHKTGEGKKIIEIKPDTEWHKGKAVNWIMDQLSKGGDTIPLYIGDDITDEDAFEAVKEDGVGILVGSHGQKTNARYTLKNVFQVREFFKKLIAMYN
jgi:trehalose 6-phosphate phosphatase